MSETKARRTARIVARPSKLSRLLTTPESKQDFLRPLMDIVDGFGQSVVATVHLNGASADNSANIVVDWGSPVDGVRLTADQQTQMTNEMKRLTRELYSTDVVIRSSIDFSHGVYWTAVG